MFNGILKFFEKFWFEITSSDSTKNCQGLSGLPGTSISHQLKSPGFVVFLALFFRKFEKKSQNVTVRVSVLYFGPQICTEVQSSNSSKKLAHIYLA